MTEHIAAFGQDSPPVAEYARINQEQAACVLAAMQQPQHQANFEVTLLPLDTPEQRWEAAVEWSAALQAAGDYKARARGAVAVFSSKDESPEALLRRFEDEPLDERVGGGVYVTHALMRYVRLKDGVSTYELFRDYYEK